MSKKSLKYQDTSQIANNFSKFYLIFAFSFILAENKYIFTYLIRISMQIAKNKYTYWKKVFRRHPVGYLFFCRLLLMQIAKSGTFLKNSGNLLHDRHKNFENRFRNSWDNWSQSWQPSFRNWHFAITQRQKNIFYAKGGNFDLNYLSYF